MEQKKEYRSAVRSRRLIRQALMELLREKPFERITVTDIVCRADINRSTFYAHYPDLNGVIDEIQEEIVACTRVFWVEMGMGNFYRDPRPVLRRIVGVLEENQELYRLIGRSELAARQLGKIKSVFIEDALNSKEIPQSIRISPLYAIRIRFFIGGAFDVYTNWLQGDLECSLEQITEDFAALIIKSMEDFYLK